VFIKAKQWEIIKFMQKITVIIRRAKERERRRKGERESESVGEG